MVEIMNEILEVESCIRRFPWLIEMVKSRLFHEVCDQHITEQRSHFCCDCMCPPLCKHCLQKSDHKDHRTIQAFKCSNKTGVRKVTISKYIDISRIQLFSVNGYPIVFINQRLENDNHRFKNSVSHKCKVCGWSLTAASTALFCSIECKFRNALGSQLDEIMESSEEDVVDHVVTRHESSKEDVVELVLKRKHRRKGIPYRSPFY